MPNNYEILPVTPTDFEDWDNLTYKLFPEHMPEERERDKRDNREIFDSLNQEAFLIRNETGEAIAFIDLSLRSDYVVGSRTSPVAYVEGIYVEEAYRKQGIAGELIRWAEEWGLAKGCTELASDALIDNTVSHQFHKGVGFREVERVVAFIKEIPG